MQNLDVSAIFQPQYLTIFHLLDNLFNIFFLPTFQICHLLLLKLVLFNVIILINLAIYIDTMNCYYYFLTVYI